MPFRSALFQLTQLFYTGSAIMPYHKVIFRPGLCVCDDFEVKFEGYYECSCKALSNDNFELNVCLEVISIVVEGDPPQQTVEVWYEPMGCGRINHFCSCSQTSCCEFLL